MAAASRSTWYTFLAWRLAKSIPVLFAAAFLVFVLVDFVPGDPSITRNGQPTDSAERARWLEENGFNDPIPIRYVRFLGEAIRGDFGFTLVSRQEVSKVIAETLPITLQLTGFAILIAVLLAILVGGISATKYDTWFGRLLQNIATLMMSTPNYWLSIVVVGLLSVNLRLLPSGGYTSIAEGGISGWAQSLIIPSTMLAIPIAGALARIVRTSILEELEKDYMQFARTQGLSPARLITKHLVRNVAIAPVTVLGLYAGYLLAGAAFIETAMSIPGIGRLLVDAALKADIWTLRAVAVLVAAIFLAITALVDLALFLLDPRTREMS
ncbi:ABC transporter permease [Celeribacter sp.]|uniref:ABC transporter permease n=1 Tax=Celeribacter sp. TaxID=1890673 RepID=UPI003A942A78